MSDKARFYLEQGLPELQKLERKKIFTKEEIQAISRKRSHHEHRIAAARCKPADFLAYATYEMNLDALRQKRMKRLSIRLRGSSNYSGSRSIFFIFQRATNKFHGDVQLWKTYAEFCRAQKSYGRLRKVLDSMLRLHPTNPDLWIYAAKVAIDDTDNMADARNYMQKGLRFSRRTSKELWVEYAKFECVFISKVAEKTATILGLENSDAPDPNGLNFDDIEEDSSVTLEGDEIMLPEITESELNGEPEPSQEDENLRQKLTEQANKDVLEGVIPIIVFEEAIEAIPNDSSLPVAFFKMFERFGDLACQKKLLACVDVHLMTTYPTDAGALLCHVRESLAGIQITDAAFPAALKVSFKRFGEARSKTDDKKAVYDGFVSILGDILGKGRSLEGGLDESLEKALRLFLGRVVRWSQEDHVELANASQVAEFAL
ncbi:U3 snoRNP protein [Orbilia blumenaviensis]|uniref:U3 snoRNP protein n=1 Tax=Orbilia blumenaviensis TaxID=1796055 RepID=A0AAV9VFU0_9PEZI